MKNQGSPEQMQQLEELNDQLVASLDAVEVNNPLQIEQEGVGKLLTNRGVLSVLVRRIYLLVS